MTVPSLTNWRFKTTARRIKRTFILLSPRSPCSGKSSALWVLRAEHQPGRVRICCSWCGVLRTYVTNLLRKARCNQGPRTATRVLVDQHWVSSKQHPAYYGLDRHHQEIRVWSLLVLAILWQSHIQITDSVHCGGGRILSRSGSSELRICHDIGWWRPWSRAKAALWQDDERRREAQVSPWSLQTI